MAAAQPPGHGDKGPLTGTTVADSCRHLLCAVPCWELVEQGLVQPDMDLGRGATVPAERARAAVKSAPEAGCGSLWSSAGRAC